LSISRLSLYGNPNVGAFTFATDSFGLVPFDMPEGVTREFSATLDIPVCRVSIGGSVLLGIFAIGNTKGLILPYTVTDEELSIIENSLRIPVAIYEGKKNALGNMILVNERTALVGVGTDAVLKDLVASHLKVEVHEGTIAGINMTGVCAAVNEKGVVAHPLTSEAELANLGKIFNMPVDVSTINCGFPYLRVGMTANSKGVVVGEQTTGPEMARIESSLGLQGD